MEPVEKQNTLDQKNEVKPLFSVVLEVYPDGRREIRIDKPEEDKPGFPLVVVRELLTWGRDFINDRILEGVVKSHLKQFGQEKIIKPGFRPMRILDRLCGK